MSDHSKAHNETQDDSPLLLRDSTDGIVTITLNRPGSYNVLSEEMLAELQGAVDGLEKSDRVLIIKALGKAFCAGHDLKQMRAHPEQRYYDKLFQTCSHFMNTLIGIEQPVIAEVQGIATAAGCQLVANCDLAVSSDQARFAVSGIDVGLFCSTPSVPLSRNVSRKRAFEMLMTGEFVDAHQAKDWGLVNNVVPHQALSSATMELANKIKRKSAVAVATGKGLFYQQLEMPLADAYKLAGETMACNMMSEDAAEGIDAFKEKRSPVWRHK